MTDASGPHGPVRERRPATDEFAELVCREPSWLDAEFTAIINANFGAAEPRPPSPHRDIPATPRPVAGPMAAGPIADDLVRSARHCRPT